MAPSKGAIGKRDRLVEVASAFVSRARSGATVLEAAQVGRVPGLPQWVPWVVAFPALFIANLNDAGTVWTMVICGAAGGVWGFLVSGFPEWLVVTDGEVLRVSGSWPGTRPKALLESIARADARLEVGPLSAMGQRVTLDTGARRVRLHAGPVWTDRVLAIEALLEGSDEWAGDDGPPADA